MNVTNPKYMWVWATFIVVVFKILCRKRGRSVENQRFIQDQNFACRWKCARPSRNLASTRGAANVTLMLMKYTHAYI